LIGAGPGPVFGFGNKASFDRVALDVVGDRVELSVRTDPVIVVLALPEWAVAAEGLVGPAGGGNFEPTDDFGEWDEGANHQVDVVRHCDSDMEFIGLADFGSMVNGGNENFGDGGFCQPYVARFDPDPVRHLTRRTACLRWWPRLLRGFGIWELLQRASR
jgi:hypothetical protein